MSHLDGYDHRGEECPNPDDTFMEDRREDHSAHQAEVHQEEVHQVEVYREGAHQCLFPPLQLSQEEETTN
jgi:hypothetical protein